MEYSSTKAVRIVAISDTHSMHRALVLPEGDILIHAGDLTGRGQLEEIEDFNSWLGMLPFQYKIIIAGNHDWAFQLTPDIAQRMLTNGIYLQDSGIHLLGLKFWGSPWQPWFFNWAFNLHRGRPLREKWDLIAPDTDVLITHGPPQGIGDLTISGDQAGCEELLTVVKRVSPTVHIFGHIHEGYGIVKQGATTFVNASTCTFSYQPINQPIILDVYPREYELETGLAM